MSKPSADFISKLNKWSFNSIFVEHIFPCIQGFLHTLLELSPAGHIHFEEDARADTALQKRSQRLGQSRHPKYGCLLPRLAQGPNLFGNL